MPITVIIGANRGIGLELCRKFAQKEEPVVAVCRQTSEKLDALEVEVIQDIDVSRSKDVQTLKYLLKTKVIGTLIHNAGVLHNESLDNMNFSNIEKQLQINTIAPLRVIQALQDNFRAGSKIGILSSRMGSMTDNESGGMYGYRMSKAATNMAGVSLAKDLSKRQISVALLHPGYVSTVMTNYKGNVSPQQSAQGLVKIMDNLSMENSGSFWHAEGYALPW